MSARDAFLVKAARLANIALVLGGGLSIAVFVYLFWQYTVTQQQQFRSPEFKFLYYAVPLLVAGYYFAAVRFAPAQRVRIVIGSVTLVVSMYVLEALFGSPYLRYDASTVPLMLRLQVSGDKVAEAARLGNKWGIEVDARNPGEILADLRKAGVDVAPIITPSNELFVEQSDGSIRSAIDLNGREVMPLGGVSNTVTLVCNENGQWLRYRSDSHGFNNPPAAWLLKDLQIAAVGDSFTQGYCVPAAKSFMGLIRQRYTATLNLGMAGNGPLLMLATLREYLPTLKPKVVLWFYCEANDLVDLPKERRSAMLREYLKEGFTQPALARQSDIDHAITSAIPGLKTLDKTYRPKQLGRATEVDSIVAFAKFTALRQRAGLIGGMDENDERSVLGAEDSNFALFRDVLRRAKSDVDEWGGRLVFVYLPDWTRYSNYRALGKERRNDVLKIVGDLGIPTIDLVPAFDGRRDPMSLFPFHGPGHYSESGHMVAAEQILETLSGRFLPPSQ